MKILKRIIKFLLDGIKEFYTLANFTYRKKMIAASLICLVIALTVINPQSAWLLALAPVAFIQNMFFTLVSRSRNSQDTDYHRFCAWGSNGVWFVCQVMIVKNIWSAIHAGQWWYAIAAGVVYSLATTEGSVLMMKRLIKSEKGKRRVGANDKIDILEARVRKLEARQISPKIMGLTRSSNLTEAVSDKILNMSGEEETGIIFPLQPDIDSDKEIDEPGEISKCAMTSDKGTKP